MTRYHNDEEAADVTGGSAQEQPGASAGRPSSAAKIALEVERPRPQECWITVNNEHISVRFTPALPEGPHKVTRAEMMAAGALLGIAGVLTGKGADDVMRALVVFERQARKGARA